jgi:Putative beta-barrel porin 2
MEEIMGGLTIWWRGRRLALRQQWSQEGYRNTAGIWRFQEVIVVLLTLIVTPAYGQVGQEPTRLTLTPSLSLGERYDDNIFETPTNKQHDFITVLSPGIRVQYLPTAPTLGTQFDFNYRANIEFFADHSSENNVGHLLTLMLDSPLSPSLQVSLRELLLITDNPLARDERLSDPTGLRPASQQQRNRTIHNEAQGRADIRLGGRTSLGVLFGNLIDDVSVPEELDEFRYTVGAELGYLFNVARNSRVFVAYQVSFETFRNNGIVPSPNADAAFQVHAVGTGVRHELTPTLAVDAGVGYSFTTSDTPQKDGHDGVIGNITFTKTFNNGEASLGYVRRFSAGGSTGDVVIVDTVNARASIKLAKLTAGLDGNVSWFNFQGVTTSTATTNNSDQRFSSIRPSLTYQILRPWDVSVTYSYEYTDYTASTTANLSNHRLFLSTHYALREWLVLGLSYRYGAQHEHGGNVSQAGVSDFTDNQVMLTVTARPALRF